MLVFETGVIIFFWKTIRALISEMMQVLSDRELKKLSEHKYKRDGDYTFCEPYLQPFWSWLVEKCPMWWAANSITLIGLLVNIITSLLIVYYNPDGRQETPSWAHFAAAAGVFIYQTMDSIDGKQARRTNSASPLGELFDHGCDAVSTVVLCVAALIHCRLMPELLMLLVGGSYMGFYLAHWVTYCTGSLSFGKFDVIEIQFLMIGGFIISGLFGEDIWLTELPMVGIQLNMCLVILVVVAGFMQAIPALHTILIKGGVGRNGSTVAGTSVLFPALPIFTVLSLMAMIAKKSELSGNIYTLYPSLYLMAFGFVFAKVTSKLIVAHMCKSEVIYWDSVYFGPALLFMNQYFDFIVPEYYVLWAALIYSLLNLLHYAHAVSNQICIYLGIYCFSVQKRPATDSANSAADSASSSARPTKDNSGSGVKTRQMAANRKNK